MKTYKEMCGTTAIKLGCDIEKVEDVWQEMGRYEITLSPSSFVNQVASAMRKVGQEPNMTFADRAASAL
mgnify:CR=1 FL=1|jgi:hypothetical protein